MQDNITRLCVVIVIFKLKIIKKYLYSFIILIMIRMCSLQVFDANVK